MTPSSETPRDQQLPPWYTAPASTSGQFLSPREDLPNATLLLLLGIAAIVLSLPFGVALSIAVLLMSRRRLARYEARPGRYTQQSVQYIRAARTCAIVGLCLSALLFLVFVVVWLTDPFTFGLSY